MPGYRLYYLDEAGHIKAALELAYVSDQEAIAKTAEHADGRAMELWQRDRVVAKFPATGPR